MSMCDNSTYVFPTQHNSPNKAFLLRKAFPPQYNYMLFEQSLVVCMFKAAQEEQPGYGVFPQQLGYFPPFCLATRLSKTHQLSSNSQCNTEVSQSGCAPARGNFHQCFIHLASFSSDPDSQKLMVSKENSDWMGKKRWKICCWYILALLSPHLEEERGKTHKGKDREILVPKAIRLLQA